VGLVTTVDPAGVPTVAVRTILKATDRCDWSECGARAYVRVIFSKGSLDACAHHWNEAPDSLADKAVYIIDEIWNL
jgi:hypothetical protein